MLIKILVLVLGIFSLYGAGYAAGKNRFFAGVSLGALSAILMSVISMLLVLQDGTQAARYLRVGQSVPAVSMFTEMKSDGLSTEKVLAKIGDSYQVLELPPVEYFDPKLKAYKVFGTLQYPPGMLKVEQMPSEFGPDIHMVSFLPDQKLLPLWKHGTTMPR